MSSSQRDFHSRLWMTVGRLVLVKWPKMTRHSEWMPYREKFSVNALWATSLRKWRERGAWLEEVEALEWRGFWAGVDLRLGAIDTTNVTKNREGKERDNQKSSKTVQIQQVYWKVENVCMGNVWTCDMQKKLYHGLSPIQSYQHTKRLHTSKCIIILL